MKITHLITGLRGGGTENFLYQIVARSPHSWKQDVVYLSRDGVIGERIRQLGVATTRISCPWHFARHLAAQQPDVLHTCLFWGNQMGRWIGRRMGRMKIISSQRAIQVWEKPWHRILDRWTLPWCDGVVVNSSAAEDLVRRRLQARARQPWIARVMNGLDFAQFHPLDRHLARQAFELPDNAVVGGTLIRLHQEKGADKIPDFAERVLSTIPELTFVIAGVGPLESRLKDQTARWGKRIRWVGWQNDAVRLLSSLDFFWLLSREESFPQALLEASGMGLPWMAPDVGDIRNLEHHGAAGLLYPTGDIATAVLRCQDLVQRRQTLTRAAQAAIPGLQQTYGLDRMVKTFYDLLERIEEPGTSPKERV